VLPNSTLSLALAARSRLLATFCVSSNHAMWTLAPGRVLVLLLLLPLLLPVNTQAAVANPAVADTPSPCEVRSQPQLERCLQNEARRHIQILAPNHYQLPGDAIPARPLLLEGVGAEASRFVLEGCLRVTLTAAQQESITATATATATSASPRLLTLRNLTFTTVVTTTSTAVASSPATPRPLVHVSAATDAHLTGLLVSAQDCAFEGGEASARWPAAHLLVEGALVADLRDCTFRHALGTAVLLRNTHATSSHLLVGVLFEQNRASPVPSSTTSRPASMWAGADTLDLCLENAGAQLMNCRFLGGRCPASERSAHLPVALRQRLSARSTVASSSARHLEVQQCVFENYGTATEPCGGLLRQSGSDTALLLSDSELREVHTRDQPAVYSEAALAVLRRVSVERVQCDVDTCAQALVCTGDTELDSCALLASSPDHSAVAVLGDVLTLRGTVTVRGHVHLDHAPSRSVCLVQTKGAATAVKVQGTLFLQALEEVRLLGEGSTASVAVTTLEVSGRLRVLTHRWQTTSLLGTLSDVEVVSGASLAVGAGSLSSLLLERGATLSLRDSLASAGPVVLDGTLQVTLAASQNVLSKLSAPKVLIDRHAVLAYQFSDLDYSPSNPDLHYVIEVCVPGVRGGCAIAECVFPSEREREREGDFVGRGVRVKTTRERDCAETTCLICCTEKRYHRSLWMSQCFRSLLRR
jgi:hypothetical protein